MSISKTFKTKKEFNEFDLNHLEKGKLFQKIKIDKPFDVSIKDFLDLEWMIISFGDYHNETISLKFSSTTNEIFIGDMNDAGHIPRCRLIKFDRKDIYHNSKKMISWMENRSYNIWTT